MFLKLADQDPQRGSLLFWSGRIIAGPRGLANPSMNSLYSA
ncbi:hypothetical protein SS05631_a49230 (plasmid) [Sinorhizobium sp. CCBAU 05631]|nr:hypothetical protein SS05631_a49230 [Sinorhizobium sp. CCBAU 05631]ASY74275.1 hypothetical protein SF83666_a46890 [Sinorhizobium fredii CCBAU 83666]